MGGSGTEEVVAPGPESVGSAVGVVAYSPTDPRGRPVRAEGYRGVRHRVERLVRRWPTDERHRASLLGGHRASRVVDLRGHVDDHRPGAEVRAFGREVRRGGSAERHADDHRGVDCHRGGKRDFESLDVAPRSVVAILASRGSAMAREVERDAGRAGRVPRCPRCARSDHRRAGRRPQAAPSPKRCSSGAGRARSRCHPDGPRVARQRTDSIRQRSGRASPTRRSPRPRGCRQPSSSRPRSSCQRALERAPQDPSRARHFFETALFIVPQVGRAGVGSRRASGAGAVPSWEGSDPWVGRAREVDP